MSQEEETLTHIFSCQRETAQQTRRSALTTYRTTLVAKGTPPDLLEIIIKGITEGVASKTQTEFHQTSVTVTTDTGVLEQSKHIGWVTFLQGFISEKWKAHAYTPEGKQTGQRNFSSRAAGTWAKAIIKANWQYSKTLWTARNAVIHSKDASSTDAKVITTLKRRIRELYNMYNKDKYCVQYTRAYLFDKPLLILQQMQQSSMDNWVTYIEEAVATRQCKEDLHNKLSRTIMGRFLAMGRNITKSDSHRQRPHGQIKLTKCTPRRARRKVKGHDNSLSSADSTSILHPIWTRKTSGGKEGKPQTKAGTPKETVPTGRGAKIQVSNSKARKAKKRSVVKKSTPL
jgi:hypothetical protein